MERRALAPNAGMLFPFDPPRPASFWMRNTLIPLDMIFIRPDGSIARVAANAVPLSETPIAVDRADDGGARNRAAAAPPSSASARATA